MNFKKIISIFLVAVSAISMSSACCHAVDGSAEPEFVKLSLGFSADDKCESEDGKNNCDKDDKEEKDDKNDEENKDE